MTKAELLQIAKPVLFNTEMVKAILEGGKTVTRRLVRKYDIEALLNSPFHKEHPEVFDIQIINKLCIPPYQKGDILYVRETWYKGLNRIMYKANYLETEKFYQNGKEILIKWKPSIHMPKEAARIFLKVKDVRVERLQDITEGQAKAEGANLKNGKNVGFEEKVKRSAIERFEVLWNSTINKTDVNTYGWDANPWVWVIEFERIESEK